MKEREGASCKSNKNIKCLVATMFVTLSCNLEVKLCEKIIGGDYERKTAKGERSRLTVTTFFSRVL